MTNKLVEENPWILEHEGFQSLSLGIPYPYTNIDDELGLVIAVLNDEDVKSMKQLFADNLGSSSRWEGYPIYYIKNKPYKLL